MKSSVRFRGRAPAWVLPVLALSVLALPAAAGQVDGRWYTTGQVEQGRTLYADNCAECHGSGGEGQPNWQQQDSMGFYPAPPLNGDGHANQHAMADMLRLLEVGGGPGGGTMPSFADVLDEAQQRAVLAYMQSLWTDSTFSHWQDVESGKAAATAPGSHDHH